jgi:hypothetical protein
MTAITEVVERLEQCFGVIKEVAQDDDKTPARNPLRNIVEDILKRCLVTRLRGVDLLKDRPHLACT